MSAPPSNKGLDFGEALLLLFTGFKLADVIDWSWWIVLWPLWVMILVGALQAALREDA